MENRAELNDLQADRIGSKYLMSPSIKLPFLQFLRTCYFGDSSNLGARRGGPASFLSGSGQVSLVAVLSFVVCLHF